MNGEYATNNEGPGLESLTKKQTDRQVIGNNGELLQTHLRIEYERG